jgi:hypothetical protein
VGVAASFTAKRRAELLAELAPLTEGALHDHPWRDWAMAEAHEEARLPGAQSRWSAGKDLSWVPLRVERVVEVTFGQLQSGRFRQQRGACQGRAVATGAGRRFAKEQRDRQCEQRSYATVQPGFDAQHAGLSAVAPIACDGTLSVG